MIRLPAPPPTRARQEWFYAQQVHLARALALPVIVHVRQSSDALLKVLRATPVISGIAHAFNGSFQQAQAFTALNFKLGLGGAITHARALKLRDLAQRLPLDSLVLETDAPDMPPQWLYRTAAERADVAQNTHQKCSTTGSVLRMVTPSCGAFS